jgi:hypothetical protein
MGENYSAGIIGPDEEAQEEEVPTTEEFLDALNRNDMLEFFVTVDTKGYKKAIKKARGLVRKFIAEDTKLGLLRAFFILSLFNLTDYKFIREMYKEAAQITPIAQLKLTDVYHASLVLEDNRDFDKQLEALAPYIREIVYKLVNDVLEVRSRQDSHISVC